MRIIILLLMIFTFNALNSQEEVKKVKKSEAKSIVGELSPEEKVKLLNEIIASHPKLLDKTLVKAIRKTDKKKIDGFMFRRGKDFKIMDRSKLMNPPTESSNPKATTTAPATPKTPVVVAPATPAKTKKPSSPPVATKTVKEPFTINNSKDKKAKPEQASNSTSAKPKPTYVVRDVNAPPPTTIQFEETVYDFGTIKDGESVTHTYVFTNTGTAPFVISNAKGSCGCTVPKWSREPIAPGESSEIVVTFNSRGKGREGGVNQNKRVTITGNTDPANTYLSIKGIVTK